MTVRAPAWTLQDRLRKAREAGGFRKPADLADELGVSDHTVRNYERGATYPSKALFHLYAEVCDVPLEWIIGDDEQALEIMRDRRRERETRESRWTIMSRNDLSDAA